MENCFRVKLLTGGRYSTQAGECIHTLMKTKFLYPAKQSNSNIIVNVYCTKEDIYLEVRQNTEIYTSIEQLLRELEIVFKINGYELEYDEAEHTFFEEFVYSYSLPRNVEDGLDRIYNLIAEMMTLVNDDEKKLDEYNSLIVYHTAKLNNCLSPKDIQKYADAFVNFIQRLNIHSAAGSYYWYKYNRIHTDEYSAQEHFKEIVKPIHLKLKSLGFKKKAFKFIYSDKKKNIEKVIWLQKSYFSRQDEVSFVINF